MRLIVSERGRKHSLARRMGGKPSVVCITGQYSTLFILLQVKRDRQFIPEYKRSCSVSTSAHLSTVPRRRQHSSVAIDGSRPTKRLQQACLRSIVSITACNPHFHYCTVQTFSVPYRILTKSVGKVVIAININLLSGTRFVE